MDVGVDIFAQTGNIDSTMTKPTIIDWGNLPSPIMVKGDSRTAHRDPAAIYHDGVFRVFHSLVTRKSGVCLER